MEEGRWQMADAVGYVQCGEMISWLILNSMADAVGYVQCGEIISWLILNSIFKPMTVFIITGGPCEVWNVKTKGQLWFRNTLVDICVLILWFIVTLSLILLM